MNMKAHQDQAARADTMVSRRCSAMKYEEIIPKCRAVGEAAVAGNSREEPLGPGHSLNLPRGAPRPGSSVYRGIRSSPMARGR